MRLAVDVDGVLADRIGALVERINDSYDLALAYEDVDRYDFSIPNTDVDIHDVVEESTRDSEHLLGLEPIDGAVAGMQTLYDRHEIVIATHRPQRIHDDTKRWLRAHDIPYDRFLPECGPQKADVQASLLVDDRPANVRAFAHQRGSGVLFAQPWNHNAEGDSGVVTVDDWASIVRLCDKEWTTLE